MLIATNHHYPSQCSPSERDTLLFTPITSGQNSDRSQWFVPSADPYYHHQMLPDAARDEDEYFKPPADINVSFPATNLHSTHGFTSDDNLVLPATFYNTKQQQRFPSLSSQQQLPPPPISIIRHSEHCRPPNKRRKVSESSITAHPAITTTASPGPDIAGVAARPFPTPPPLLVTPTDATGSPAQSPPFSLPQSVILAPPASAEVRFYIVLQAPTAATQISDGPPTTYLNRGQPYWLRLTDRYEHDTVMTSTLMITFHEPAHRKVALNYWKFWRSQQPNPKAARAVSLDEQQPSKGIYNVRFPSFDRIEFEWNASMGAKMLIRFNCLSTDFSRIKGVKGIPLRVQIESKLTIAATSIAPGSLQNQYVEQSFCKIKLFRDKGAERKNKDDAKQIWKHMERIYGSGRQQPYWLTYNQPRPYTVFSSTSSIPLSPSRDTSQDISSKSSSTPSSQGYQVRKNRKAMMQHQVSMGRKGRSASSSSSSTCETAGIIPTASVEAAGPPTLTPSGLSPILPTQCSFFIHVKTTQHQRFHEPPLQHNDKKRLYPIHLDEKRNRVTDLISLICPILSLDPSQVSEILWKQPQHSPSSSTAAITMVPVGDASDDNPHHALTQHLIPGSVVTVEWEIIANGTVRLVFQS